jgi:hypothetical protein
MKLRIFVKFLFPMLLFSLPGVYADDVSKGRDYFLNQCQPAMHSPAIERLIMLMLRD